MTDEQWLMIAPLLPPPSTDGRPEKHPRREIVNAIFYVLRTGCAWRQLPHDLPPWQTVYWYFKRWRDDGTVTHIHDALRDRLRDTAGRDPMASAGIVDAQSVKAADTVGRQTRGYDAGKRVNGRKRHVVVDTLGLLLVMVVTAANIQDRDGGARVLERLRFAMPSVATIFADGGYAGRLVAYARQRLRIAVEVVRKPADQQGFAVLPRRWVVERTLGWIVRCRRLDHDYERLPATAAAWTKWAMIGIMTRRLAPGPGRRPWQPTSVYDPISNTLSGVCSFHLTFLGCLRQGASGPRETAARDALGLLADRCASAALFGPTYRRRDAPAAQDAAGDYRDDPQGDYHC